MHFMMRGGRKTILSGAPTQAETAEEGAAVGALTLNVHSTSAGTFPYSATVLPARGTVPSGQTLVSTQDTSMRASILSTWDDGSAAVVVVAGSKTVGANEDSTIALDVGTASGTNLTTSAISAVVTSVAVNFQGTYGSATLSSFGSPEVTWWTNPQVICCRYRLAAPTPGSTALEAVIDIHAYAGGRAQVEVVIENAKMTTSSPTKPAAATYTGATVSVNGSTIATVDSTGPTSAEGNHAAFRAWYASGWVGGDPGLRVTQSIRHLQYHPLFWRIDRPSTFAMSGYASDAYSPWTTGRQRGTGMGGTGDHASIGPLPLWEARALQSGDYRAWLATEVSALAALSFNINYRDIGTGLVPTFAQFTASQAIASSTWPSQTNGNDAAMWEVAHMPAVGLMAFVGRPSPVFIEIAQKACVWAGMWSRDSMDNWSGTRDWEPGLFGYWYQIRGRGWGIRSLVHALFITPSSHAWRTAGVTTLGTNADFLATWQADSKHILNTVTDYRPDDPKDYETGASGFQNSELEVAYLFAEVHKAANARLLSGSAQTTLASFADWMALGPVRFVNEQTNGGWRYIAYRTTIGDQVANFIGSASTWLASRNYASSPPAVNGNWKAGEGIPDTFASGWTDYTSADSAYYPVYFYSLLATAIERGPAQAPRAWYDVWPNITNIETWRSGFATDPRWGVMPRSITASGADTSVWDGGNGAAYKGDQTFTALQAVYDGIASTGGWAQLANTNIQDVVPTNAQLDAISPNPVMRQGEQDIHITIWGSACFNGFGFFYVIPGGHFAGYRNDTYSVRLADPVAAIRMHMPSPIASVYGRAGHPTNAGTLIDPSLWASQDETLIVSTPAWGPRGCHQYASMVWDATTEQMVMAGDNQSYDRNIQTIGSAPDAFPVVYVFDPYAPTPRSAWTRLRTNGTQLNLLAGMNNGDGTCTFRGNPNSAERFTVNLTTRNVTSGAVLQSPVADQYYTWRHCARDPANNKTYELHSQTWGADGLTAALWETTTGTPVKVANLPASWWSNSEFQDGQSTIVIVNSKAYVCQQTQAGSTNTVQLGVHQINLSTGAVASFTTSPDMPTPDGLYSNISLNGLHGRFAYVSQVGAFVVLLSARDDVWVFRPPASWSV